MGHTGAAVHHPLPRAGLGRQATPPASATHAHQATVLLGTFTNTRLLRMPACMNISFICPIMKENFSFLQIKFFFSFELRTIPFRGFQSKRQNSRFSEQNRLTVLRQGPGIPAVTPLVYLPPLYKP